MTRDENEVQASVSSIEQKCKKINIFLKQHFLQILPVRNQEQCKCFNFNGLQLMTKEYKQQIVITQPILKKTLLNNNNRNALSGYVSIISIGFKGKVNFFLKIIQLVTTSVTVDIVGNYENVTQLGYQIILGADGSFKKLNDSYFSDKFTSENYKLESNYTLANCFYGFDFSNSENLDFLSSIQENQTNNSFSYSIQPSLNNRQYYLGGGGNHNSVFLIAQYIQIPPLQFQKLSVKQFEDFVTQKEAQIIISYLSKDQNFSNIGVYPIFVDKEFDKIQILTQIKCQLYQTIKSTFNKFKKSVKQKSLNLIHNCDYNIKQINFELVQKNTDKSYQELVIIISEMSYSVSQIQQNFE